jgi:Ca-activated chloride channel family protein
MMHLAQPILLTLGVLFLLPLLLRHQRAWRYSSLQLLPVRKHTGFMVWSLTGVLVAALALLLLALARPQRITPLPQQTIVARDIVLTLDLSLSMEAYIPKDGDAIPSVRRLALAQEAAQDFVKRHTGDRLGLIVFGDEAFGAWPLSTDSTTLQRRLEQLDKLLPAQLRGTYIEKGLVKSLDHLQELGGQAATRIVVMLTDGLDTIPAAQMEHLLQRLQREKVTLYVLGIQIKNDSSIAVLARRAQGGYFAIDKVEQMAAAFAEIEQLEKSRMLVTQGTTSEELYRFFAIPGLVCLLAGTVCKSLWVWEV